MDRYLVGESVDGAVYQGGECKNVKKMLEDRYIYKGERGIWFEGR